FGVSALVLFLPLSEKLLGVGWNLSVILPLALSSTAIFYSADFKPYSADLFFSVALPWLTLGALERGYTRTDSILFPTTACLTVWFSFASVFVTVACVAVLVYRLAREPGARIRGLIGAGVVALSLALTYALQIRRTISVGIEQYHAAGYLAIGSMGELARWCI